MKFAFYTLGCKTNQYETQAMERLLVELGHTIGSFEETCDGYVINTCSVTAVADKKTGLSSAGAAGIIRKRSLVSADVTLSMMQMLSGHWAPM